MQADASLSNIALAARVGVSPPTCLRRVAHLRRQGLIEAEIALVQPDLAARALGSGLMALVEISLDRQDAESLARFEARACADAEVQQCWRVSPGPDFVLVVGVADMPGYQALVERLFTADRNVRNVKTYFSVKRAKFAPRVVLPPRPPAR